MKYYKQGYTDLRVSVRSELDENLESLNATLLTDAELARIAILQSAEAGLGRN